MKKRNLPDRLTRGADEKTTRRESNGYAPVKFNPKGYAAPRARTDAEFAEAYAEATREGQA